MLLLLAIAGLAFDVGRIYIAHNEAQVFTDSAALTAALKLDGTSEGLKRARAAAVAVPMKWNLGSKPFTGVEVEFSSDGKAWEAEPRYPSQATLARVSAPQNDVEIVFLRAVGGPAVFRAPAHSVAAANPARLVE